MQHDAHITDFASHHNPKQHAEHVFFYDMDLMAADWEAQRDHLMEYIEDSKDSIEIDPITGDIYF